ncbi:MAG: hypothetical protein ACOCOW_06210 [Prevotella sp.]
MRYSEQNMQLRASISIAERDEANRLARSKGMTFQGWLGQLIKRELAKSQQDQLSVDP